jgi:2-keto-4-pentenoate hydratase
MTREKANEALVNALRKHGISSISKASKLLVDAHRTRTPAATGDVVLHTEAEAYSVQDAVFAALWSGARPAAWKAGGPSDKVEPTAAPIPPENLLRSPASISGAKMQMIGVEAEVAFRLAKDLPPRTRPYSERSVAAAVGEVLVAIELCDTRLVDWKKSSGLWKLADFQNNSALVVGSGTQAWQKIDFLQQEDEFRIGTRVAKARGEHLFGNSYRLLP